MEHFLILDFYIHTFPKGKCSEWGPFHMMSTKFRTLVMKLKPCVITLLFLGCLRLSWGHTNTLFSAPRPPPLPFLTRFPLVRIPLQFLLTQTLPCLRMHNSSPQSRAAQMSLPPQSFPHWNTKLCVHPAGTALVIQNKFCHIYCYSFYVLNFSHYIKKNRGGAMSYLF